MCTNRRKGIRLLSLLAWMSLVATPAAIPSRVIAANCAWTGPLPGWNHYYNGSLGGVATVRLLLAFHGCSVSGEWFDSLNFRDFAVEGSLASDYTASLALRDGSGRVIGTLAGRFVLPIGNIVGTISGPDGYHGQRVELEVTGVDDTTDAQTDATVGIGDPVAFDRATLRFWRAVRDRDADAVSKCVRYPLSTVIYEKGERPRGLVVKNAEMLERDYGEIFNAYRRAAILRYLPRHLREGRIVNTIVLGGTVAVFDPQGRVISLP